MNSPASTDFSLSAARDRIDEILSAGIKDGKIIGVAVGMVHGGDAITATAGVRQYLHNDPGVEMPAVESDTIFQIGSVTKIFTTALFGQRVAAGDYSSARQLSSFVNGALPGIAMNADLGKATLENLATFTSGINTIPSPGQMGGYTRPTIAEWGVADFQTWFCQQAPTWQYHYSNCSVGMLGLLMGSDDPVNLPLSPSDAVNDWLAAISGLIMEPLGMQDTFVSGISTITSDQQSRLAGGYQQALASATCLDGAINAVNLINGGAAYSSAPSVTVAAVDGGSGGSVSAAVDNGVVSGLTLVSGGSGYTEPPDLLIAPGDAASNNVPVWAAAGALSSTVEDMNRLIATCLTAYENPDNPAGSVAAGVNIAMQSCGTIKGDLDYGYAWEIEPGPGSAGKVIFKLGGVPGFSSYLGIVPGQDLGLVVMCNSRQPDPVTRPANNVARAILTALFAHSDQNAG